MADESLRPEEESKQREEPLPSPVSAPVTSQSGQARKLGCRVTRRKGQHRFNLPEGSMGNFVGGVMAAGFLSLAPWAWGMRRYWIPIAGIVSLILFAIGIYLPRKKQRALQLAIWPVVAVFAVLCLIGAVHSQTKSQGGLSIGTINSSGIVNVANGPMTVNQGPDLDTIKKAMQSVMQKTQEEKGPDLSKEFSLGYAIFGITGTKEIIPMRLPTGAVTVDWKNSFSTMTRDTITLTLSNVDTPIFSVGRADVSIPREVNAAQIVLDTSNGDMEVALVQSQELWDVLVLGVRGPDSSRTIKPQPWPPDRRYRALFYDLRVKGR